MQFIDFQGTRRFRVQFSTSDNKSAVVMCNNAAEALSNFFNIQMNTPPPAPVLEDAQV